MLRVTHWRSFFSLSAMAGLFSLLWSIPFAYGSPTEHPDLRKAPPKAVTKKLVKKKPVVRPAPKVVTKPVVKKKPAVRPAPKAATKPIVKNKPAVRPAPKAATKPIVKKKPLAWPAPKVVTKPIVKKKPLAWPAPKPTKPAVKNQPLVWPDTKIAKPIVKKKPAVRPAPEPMLIAKNPPLSTMTLASIALCVLRWKGDYDMFNPKHKHINLGSTKVGVFVGGFQTLSHDVGLAECIGQITKTKKLSFFGMKPLADLAKLPIYDARQGSVYHSRLINYYNPAMIRWVAKNMIPNPKQKLLGLTYQHIYNVVFKRFTRVTAYSYAYLQKNNLFSKNLRTYTNSNFQGRLSIRRKFRRLAFDPYVQGSSDYPDYTYHGGHAVTFWMRRGMDGTYLVVWKLVKKVLKLYDPSFLKILAARRLSLQMPPEARESLRIVLTPKDAAQLPALLKNALPGTRIILKAGVYSYNNGLVIDKRKNLLLEGAGAGAQIIVKSWYQDVLKVYRSSNITIRNIKARHAVAKKEYSCEGSVISIYRSQRVWIHKCELNGSGAVGVNVYRGSHIIVSENYLHSNSLAALMLFRANYIAIQKNRIINNKSTLYTLGKNSIRMLDNVVKNNKGGVPWSSRFTRQILGK